MNTTKEFFSELFGTFILILLGCGSCAMVNLFPATIGHPIAGEIIKGGYTNVVFGWGLAVVFGIFVSIRTSGAHLNPAITISFALVGRFPFAKVFHYILGQVLGAFLGALCVFTIYHAQWIKVDPALSHTEGVFSTFPAVAGWWPGLFDQICGTFVLVWGILAVLDYSKDIDKSAAYPFIIGALVLAIGISLGGMHGYAINPARDFGPRLVLAMEGFIHNGFNEARVWLVPIIGPIMGACLATVFYHMFCVRKEERVI